MNNFLEYLDKNLNEVMFDDEDDDYTNLLKTIATMISNTRNENKITQHELSEITHIQQGTISKIENGNCNLTLKMLQRVADGLGKKLIVKFE
ncbi:MAG: helix-turn-helix transcriptional regulator [Bacilli bacterium]|nr:helix-turn-helix transcriptional regulator [Bacilli bacterium]